MIVEIDVSFNHAVSIHKCRFRVVLEILIVQSLHLENSVEAFHWRVVVAVSWPREALHYSHQSTGLSEAVGRVDAPSVRMQNHIRG